MCSLKMISGKKWRQVALRTSPCCDLLLPKEVGCANMAQSNDNLLERMSTGWRQGKDFLEFALFNVYFYILDLPK